MTTLVYDHPQKGRITYRDKKRYLWLLSLYWPLVPVVAILSYYAFGNNPWILLAPLAVGYTVIPFLDWALGTDQNNPPEEIVPQLDEDGYYKWLTYLAIPLHFVTLFYALWFVANEPLNIWFYLGFAVMAGMQGGLAINTAHEIGHKNTKAARRLARIALAVPAYGHFCIEHNAGHHRDVATPEDPASSRMGESIYRFVLREIPGTAVRGWKAEAERLERRGHAFWSIKNHILQSYALSFLIQGGAVLYFGWIVVPFLIIHNVFAWFQLTSANYIEHYGLLREKKDNGRYERCQPHHSWNANHIVSNLILFHLERHSDHHANASRPYQSLRAFDNLPELPSGYFGCYLLAYVPWLWYRVMDKRVLSIPHINGDFSKINIDPKHEQRLKEKYADWKSEEPNMKGAQGV